MGGPAFPSVRAPFRQKAYRIWLSRMEKESPSFELGLFAWNQLSVRSSSNQVDQILGRILRTAGCCKDRPMIALEDLKPRGDVGGMIGPGLVANAQFGAKERRSQFSDQFFEGIGLIAKLLTKFPVEPLRRPRPMHQFVQQNGVVAFCC